MHSDSRTGFMLGLNSRLSAEISLANLVAVGQLRRRAGCNHPAFRQHVAVIRDRQCLVHVLLDEENGDARSLMRLMISKFSFTSRGDRPSDGSSIKSSFGARIRPRPMETIACSPPDIVPASCVRRSARRGNRR